MRIVDVAGDQFEVGRQHGEAVRDLRHLLQPVMCRPLTAAASEVRERSHRRLARLQAVLAVHSPATVAQLEGIASGLEVPATDLLGWVASAYVYTKDEDGGCSAWAASGVAASDGKPLLVKNRDQPGESLALQFVIRVRPTGGLSWAAVTTAGAPGVHSSGMNAAGLAIADTAVPSRDVGPGLPRLSLMQHVLEAHETVGSALAYLAAAPMMGAGNLVLADAAGTIAVVECGFTARGMSRRDGGVLTSTNHFDSAALAGAYAPSAGSNAEISSRGRYDRVAEALDARSAAVDSRFARDLMADHGSPAASVCQHSRPAAPSETISCVIFRPADGVMEICDGHPCSVEFVTIPVVAP